eukprot:symbB.v1.2.021983.t1/scaffold1899.1/size238565/19
MDPAALPASISKNILPRHNSQRCFVPYEAELAVACFVGVYLTTWAAVFCFLAGDWSLVDGLYFCMVTLTTVGYGDLCPCRSPVCRVLGMTFIWTNVLVVSALLGVIGTRVEREVTRLGRIFGVSQLTVHCAALGLFVVLLALGFSRHESKSLLDGLYFSTVTLSTVGYGALAPSKDARWLMCPMLFVSVVSVGSIAGYLAQQAEKLLKRQLKQYDKPTRAALSVFALFIFAAIGGLIFKFVGQEDWSINQAIYFAIITMTTVGFGDLAPVTTGWQKLSAILFIWLSITLLAVLFGFISAEAESEMIADPNPKQKTRKSRRAILLLLGLHLLSAASFMSIESWSFVDSMYFTSVTLTTVGDMTPKTTMGRTLTSALVLTGVPATAALVHALSGKFSRMSRILIRVQGVEDNSVLPCSADIAGVQHPSRCQLARYRIGTFQGGADAILKALDS